MNAAFRCGDHEALVAYLYDECEAGDRDDVAAHLARCASCAQEIASLRATRTVLSAWTPPDASLGFQVTRTDAREPLAFTPRTRPAGPWWREPLPAWAQVAAAALIFGAGLSLGTMRAEPARDAVATAVPAPAPSSSRVASAVPSGSGVSAADLARIEQRLRAIETAPPRTVVTAAPRAAVDDSALVERVRALIAESEERQRRENVTLIGNVVSNFEAQRRVDLRRVDENLGRITNVTGQAFRQRDEAINSLMRVGFQPPAAGR
jgi:hypothetical protein